MSSTWRVNTSPDLLFLMGQRISLDRGMYGLMSERRADQIRLGRGVYSPRGWPRPPRTSLPARCEFLCVQSDAAFSTPEIVLASTSPDRCGGCGAPRTRATASATAMAVQAAEPRLIITVYSSSDALVCCRALPRAGSAIILLSHHVAHHASPVHCHAAARARNQLERCRSGDQHLETRWRRLCHDARACNRLPETASVFSHGRAARPRGVLPQGLEP